MTKIIGITGRKFNGKDTAGKYLCDKYGYTRIAYADALKEACRIIFGFTDEQLYGGSKEIVDTFWGVTPRHVLQFVGTDLFRENMGSIVPGLDKNIWIKVVEKQILDEWKKNSDKKFVVTDVRFPNEAESIKNLGGIIVRVKREQVNMQVTDVHASEIEIENLNVDYEFLNNGTLDELYHKCDQLFQS